MCVCVWNHVYIEMYTCFVTSKLAINDMLQWYEYEPDKRFIVNMLMRMSNSIDRVLYYIRKVSLILKWFYNISD